MKLSKTQGNIKLQSILDIKSISVTSTAVKATGSSASEVRCSHLGLVPGELEQHGVVEVLVDAHVFAESLTSSRLHHEVSGEGRWW